MYAAVRATVMVCRSVVDDGVSNGYRAIVASCASISRSAPAR